MSETLDLLTPFDPAAHPRPWRIVETSVALLVIDAAGCEIMSGDHDDGAFFVFFVRAVNALETRA